MSAQQTGACFFVLKFELQRESGLEIRRTSCDVSFDELCDMVHEMWGPAPSVLSIQYKDDEGDMITIGSAAEWNEAIRQHLSRTPPPISVPLRLFVSLDVHRVGRLSDRSRASSVVTYVDPAPERDFKSFTPASNALPPDVTASLDQDQCVGRSAPISCIVKDSDTDQRLPEVVVELVSRLYDCDAAREMSDPNSVFDFQPIVHRRTTNGEVGEVLVSVDSTALYCEILRRTALWRREGQSEKAEGVLRTALTVWRDDSQLEYMLAGTAALRGDTETALTALEASIAHGNSDPSYIATDPDFERLRTDSRFRRLVRMPGSAAQGEEDPAARKHQEGVASLMSIFPELTEDAAFWLLQKHGGNVHKAANSILS